ncbi:hypothetical protein V490_09207 [Pseudogymnoascus sp. VKM F-3557]|nr:hypothetical protein V490_09207 [Pseudogymnoascus sp. VKM F-3557]
MHFDTSNLLIHRQRSATNKPWLECWVADSVDDVFRGIHIAFSSTIFRLAMKAHRQGYNTTEFLRQLSYTTLTELNWGFVKHHKADARIKSGSLLVRQLTVFMVPSWRQTPLPCGGDVYICHHIKMKTMQDLQGHGIYIPQADEIKLYENRQGILYCDRCYTEFRVDFKSYGEAGNAMFITKWMDIGEGRDLDDPKWISRKKDSDRVSWPKIDYQRGSISAAFEQTAKFMVDSLLTEQDKKDLLWEKSPMPWPEYLKGPPKEVTPYFMVRNGRFICLAEKEADSL